MTLILAYFFWSGWLSFGLAEFPTCQSECLALNFSIQHVWLRQTGIPCLVHRIMYKTYAESLSWSIIPELPSWQIRNEGQKSWKWGTMRDKKIWMRDKMRDIMEHVLKLYSYLYGTCNRHSRLTEGRRRLSSYSFDDQNEFQSSRYPNSLWLKSSGVNTLYILV